MMARLTRMVKREDWCLSDALAERRPRLLDVPKPEDLLERAIADADDASRRGLVRLAWQDSTDCPGSFRLVAQIPLSEATFDQLLNGRSGYRAQYYISPEEGILYNRDIVDGLIPAIKAAYRKQPLDVHFDLIEQSVRAPHSKIWVFEEKAAFNDAAEHALNPPRWVANGATRGRKAPLPGHYTIDVKGAFVHPATSDLFVDEVKLDRAWDLFKRGYT
jgi:hypothetical protein